MKSRKNSVLVKIQANIDGESVTKTYQLDGPEGSMKFYQNKAKECFWQSYPNGKILSTEYQLLDGRPDFPNGYFVTIIITMLIVFVILMGLGIFI